MHLIFPLTLVAKTMPNANHHRQKNSWFLPSSLPDTDQWCPDKLHGFLCTSIHPLLIPPPVRPGEIRTHHSPLINFEPPLHARLGICKLEMPLGNIQLHQGLDHGRLHPQPLDRPPPPTRRMLLMYWHLITGGRGPHIAEEVNVVSQ